MPKIPLTFRIYRAGALERTETLVQDVVKIGKLSTSHLRLEDESISRMHAVIEIAPSGEVHIIDLGSQRGTLVNGGKITKSKLCDGDEILLGDTRIIVGVGQAIAEATPVATPAAAPATSGTILGVGGPAPSGGLMQHGLVALAPPIASPAAAAPALPAPLPAPIPAPMPAFAGTAPIAYAEAVPAASAPDAAIEEHGGARAIEVLSLFGSTVLGARHLTDPSGGKPSPLTYARLAIGGALILGALVATVIGYAGVAAIGFVVGTGIGVLAWLRFQEQRQPPDFSIGDDPRASFHAPADTLPLRLFPLVRSTGNDWSLVIAPGMTGDIATGGAETDLAQMIASGRARPSAAVSGSHEWPIAADAHCTVALGENTFLVSSVARARAIAPLGLRHRDWTGDMYNGISFGAHALVLLLMLMIPPDAKSLSLDLFGADQRLIKFLVKPPEQKEEEMPEWLKKGPDDPGGKGQKHKGDEGKMGSKKSKKKEGLYGLKGPKDNVDPHLAKRLAEQAAQSAGVLGLLKNPQGSHIASIFGRDSALGLDAENALGGLIGNQIGEAYGVGGLGLVGTGRGGGGTGEGTIGLGTLGTIGKGGGGGDGAGYGRGVGRIGGRRARAPDVIPGQAQVRGSLDKEIIRRIIRRHINEVKFCYEKELIANPDLHGRVTIQFTISGAGSVVASVVQQSTMGNSKVEQCVAAAVMRWQFPKPTGGGIVMVSYPFLLQAAGGEE